MSNNNYAPESVSLNGPVIRDASEKRISMTQEDLRQVNDYINRNPAELLKIPATAVIMNNNRLKRVRPEQVLKFSEEVSDPAVIENAADYNLAMALKNEAAARPSMLVNPLSSIQFIQNNISELKVLTVGPRTDVELINLMALGFNLQNISALDLVSFSPLIDVGDMHNMPYENDSFDVIILGWVLAYSEDNVKVAEEVLRVAKPDAHIAIGCQCQQVTDDDVWRQWSDQNKVPHVTAGSRFKTTEQILSLFGEKVDDVIFKHDGHPSMINEVYDVMVVFRLQ